MVNTSPAPETAISAAVPARRDWAIAGVLLAVGICALGYLFHTEAAMAVWVWSNSDAYNHCFLVIPVAAYLAWERRQAIVATLPRPAPWFALLALPVAAAWFAADRLGIIEGRQLMAMTLFQVMVLAIVGLSAWRALATPLLYLYFLVPFGEFVVAPLQALVVRFTTIGLTLFGVPTFTDGITIQIPQGMFLVHTACSGLRFLIASLAFGVLYSCVMYTSPLRRVLFSLFAVALAIVANCFRVLGTITIAHLWGNVRAVEADHVIWGWGFYVIVGAALILIGLRFRQEPDLSAVPAPAFSGHIAGSAAAGLAAIVLIAAVPSIAAVQMNRLAAGAPSARQVAMPAIPGCAAPTPVPATTADGNTATAVRAADYRCGGTNYRLAFYRYAPRIGVRPLFVSLQAIEKPGATDTLQQTGDFRATAGARAPLWRMTVSATSDRRVVAVATGLWINGQPRGAGMTARIDQALNSVRRAPLPPVLAAVTVFGDLGPNETKHAAASFLEKTGGLSHWVDRWLGKTAGG